MVDVADAIRPYLVRPSYAAASMDDRVQAAAHAWLACNGGQWTELKSRMMIRIAAPFFMFYLEPDEYFSLEGMKLDQKDAEQIGEMRRQINKLCWYETFTPTPGATPKVWDRTYAPDRASNRARSRCTDMLDAAHAGDWHRAALSAVRAVDRQHQQPLILAIMLDAQQSARTAANLLGELCARLLVDAIGTHQS